MRELVYGFKMVSLFGTDKANHVLDVGCWIDNVLGSGLLISYYFAFSSFKRENVPLL